MNQYISLRRLGRLLRKQLAEYFTTYLLGMGVLLGCLLLFMGGVSYLESSSFPVSTQAAFFALLLLATGAFFTSTVFAALGDKRQAASLLTLPASALEKFLAGWLLSLPGFALVFVAAFYAADVVVLQLIGLRGWPHPLLNIFAPDTPALSWLLVYYPLLHGWMLCGSIFFAKNQFIRTSALGLLGLLLLALANWQVLVALLGSRARVGLAFPFAAVNVHDTQASYYIKEISVPTARLPWLGALPLLLALMLWVAAYFRLAEKQL